MNNDADKGIVEDAIKRLTDRILSNNDNEHEWKASRGQLRTAHLDVYIQPFVLTRLKQYADEQQRSIDDVVNSILRNRLHDGGM